MFRGDKCVEAGGGIWVCGDTMDEERYERNVELSAYADYVIK